MKGKPSIKSGTRIPAAKRMREVWTHLPDGRWVERVISTNNGSAYYPALTNRFVWDGQVLMAILDHTNGLVMSFVRGLDLSGSVQGAGGVGGVLAVNFASSTLNPQPSTHFVCYDGNGNVVALADASTGSSSGQFEYGPFSEPIRVTGMAAQAMPLRFSTMYEDSVTGDRKYLFRDLNPSTGRWKSRDPIEEPGFLSLHKPPSPLRFAFSGEDDDQGLEGAYAHAAYRKEGGTYHFVINSPNSSLDVLGLYKRNGKQIVVEACEIVYLFGHQNPNRPWNFKLEKDAIAGGFNGCWPGRTNGKLPLGARIFGVPLHDKEEWTLPPDYVPGQGPYEKNLGLIYDMLQEDPDKDWRRWHEAIKRGIQSMGRLACKLRCCPEITIYEVNTPKKLLHTPADEKWVWSCPL